MALATQTLREIETSLEIVVSIDYFAANRDWNKIEKLIDYVDVPYEKELYLFMLLTVSAKYRNFLNNWYVLRDDVIDEFAYRNISPYIIQHIRTL